METKENLESLEAVTHTHTHTQEPLQKGQKLSTRRYSSSQHGIYLLNYSFKKKQKRKILRERGITLTVLVITVVVLLILAGVTLTTALGDKGIISKAQENVNRREIESLKTRMELIYLEMLMEGEVIPDEYFKELEKEDIINNRYEDVKGPDENNNYEVTTKPGYVFDITIGDGDIDIEYAGLKDRLRPRIVAIEVTEKTENSLNIEVHATRVNGAKYKYYIKKVGEDYENPIEKSENTCNFTGLEPDVRYIIKVEVTNKYGMAEREKTVYMGEEEETIQVGEITWTDGFANITLQSMSKKIIQYQVNGKDANKWLNYTQTITGLKHGEIVYARLWDGRNEFGSTTVNIKDEKQPQEAVITFSSTGTDTQTGITATVTQADNETGLEIGNCRWVYNQMTAVGEEPSSYTGGNFSTSPQTLTLNATAPGTYYLHVLTVDKAGNKRVKRSEPVIVNAPTVAVTEIVISQTTAELEIGDTLNLTADVMPSNATTKAVTWTSSNPNIATVSSNGVVTAVAEGNASITVTATDGSGKSATCEVKVKAYFPENWDLDMVIAVESADNKIVPVPKGFTASKVKKDANNEAEDTVVGGFVIYQNLPDTEEGADENKVTNSNVETAKTTRNQFVWVPYSEFESEITKMFTEDNSNPPSLAGQLYDFGTSSSPKNPAGKIAYPTTKNYGWREPDVVTNASSGSNSTLGKNYDADGTYLSIVGISSTGFVGAEAFKTQLKNEFKDIKDSVEKYGGFYIGRYETGGLDTAVTSPAKVVKGQGDGQINKQNWYTQYQKSKKIAEGTNATSSMIWGSQWDATLNWLLSQDEEIYLTNSSGKGNYKTETITYVDSTGKTVEKATGTTSLIPTGSSEQTKVKNIYDMAGNVWDWTIEAYDTSYRTVRRRQLLQRFWTKYSFFEQNCQ